MSAIIAVTVIGFVCLLAVKGAFFLSLGGLESGRKLDYGSQAFYSAQSCLDEALRRIKHDNSYEADNKALELDRGACAYSVSSFGSEKTVNIIGTAGNHQKALTARIDLSGAYLDLVSLADN